MQKSDQRPANNHVRSRNIEDLLVKAPLHIANKLRADFKKCRVPLVSFEIFVGSDKVSLTGYDAKGKSYSITYPTAQFFWNDYYAGT